MNYTNDPNQVVFLKDSDIIQDIAGNNISGDSVEQNGIASYTLVSAISNDTSAAIDSLMSDILSVNDLISNGTTGISTQIKFLSDTIQEPISSTISSIELSVQNNNTDIETIRKDIKGGVVYQGHLKLDHQTDVYALSDYVAFLYDNNAYQHTQATLEKPLSNGWMYYIDFNPANTGHAGITDVGSFETKETDVNNPHITFVPGNYIIVHTHNEDDCVILSDLGRDQIDIIQVTDSDLVRFKDLNAVSNALCGSTTALVSSISNTLSDAIDTHIGEYSQLCTDLSTAIATVTNDVNTTISNAIDKKVRLSSYGNPDIQDIGTLMINRLPVTQYKTLVDNENVADDQIYVVEDDNYSLFGRSISDVNDIQATSGHIDDMSVGNLTAANVIQAAGLNVNGNGTVNVANVNASQQISVANDAFYAKQNGEVSAKNLTATTLSVTDNFTLKNGNNDGISAKSTGLTANGMISANQLIAKTRIVLNEKLTADANKTVAVALSTPSLTADSTSAGSITANSIAVNSETASNLTATSLSSQTLTVATKIQLFNDNFEINRDSGDGSLNIRTIDGTTDNPKLKINGQLFKDYYAKYLSAEYLSDGYIDSVTVDTSAINNNTVWGLKFEWNEIAGKAPTFIALSSLGGIYEGDGNIISIDKSDPNEFKINASSQAISAAISEALSDEFGLANVKSAIENKVILKEGIGGEAQKLESLNIVKLDANTYRGITPDNNTIYVLTDNDMDVLDNKIINVKNPENNKDAANKIYVDNAISSLAIVNDGNAKKIILKAGNTALAEFSTTDFIKDGFLSSVTIGLDDNGKKALKFVWNTDVGTQKTDVLLTDIAKPYAGDNTYITVTNNENDASQTISLNADAVSTNIKVAMYNEFESKITNNTTGAVYTKDQVNSISLSLSTTVANDYAAKTDYVSKNELSNATNGILKNYCTINNYYDKTTVQGLSATLTADAAGQIADKLTSYHDKNYIQDHYYDKATVQGLSVTLTANAAGQITTALNNYYDKTTVQGLSATLTADAAGQIADKLTSYHDKNYIQDHYYDKATVQGLSVTLTANAAGQITTALADYALLTAVNSHITSLKNGITTNNIGTIDSSDPDLALADVADKLNYVILAVEQIKSVLSGLNLIN